MTYMTRDVHGRLVTVDTDHGHVTIKVGDRTAEVEPTAAAALCAAVDGEQLKAREHRCDDCAEETP